MISRLTVQRVTNIEKTTAEVKDTYQMFDEAIRQRMKIISEQGYTRDKPNPEHWADLLKNDDNFREEFERIFNNYEIPEADEVEYTPDTLDDTYLNMEVALPQDGEGPELARVVKHLRDGVDDEGYHTVLMQEIVNYRVKGREVKKDDAFIISPNGGQRRKETTKGWDILVQWKDGSTS